MIPSGTSVIAVGFVGAMGIRPPLFPDVPLRFDLYVKDGEATYDPTAMDRHIVELWGDLKNDPKIFVKEGTMIKVTGKLIQHSALTADGNTRYITNIEANKIHIVSR